MTLNDFKAIEGDKQAGRALAAGAARRQGAAWVACVVVMIVPQFVVVGLLFAWVQPVHAAAVAALVMVQAVLMVRFLENPVARATWLSGLGVAVYVSGMMISAFAVRAASRRPGPVVTGAALDPSPGRESTPAPWVDRAHQTTTGANPYRHR
jgi:chlorophyll synthase